MISAVLAINTTDALPTTHTALCGPFVQAEEIVQLCENAENLFRDEPSVLQLQVGGTLHKRTVRLVVLCPGEGAERWQQWAGRQAPPF